MSPASRHGCMQLAAAMLMDACGQARLAKGSACFTNRAPASDTKGCPAPGRLLWQVLPSRCCHAPVQCRSLWTHLTSQQWHILNDGQPHAPVLVSCQLLDGWQQRLRQQVHANDSIDLLACTLLCQSSGVWRSCAERPGIRPSNGMTPWPCMSSMSA